MSDKKCPACGRGMTYTYRDDSDGYRSYYYVCLSCGATVDGHVERISRRTQDWQRRYGPKR